MRKMKKCLGVFVIAIVALLVAGNVKAAQITYNANGGSGDPMPTTTLSGFDRVMGFPTGCKVNLANNTFEKTGYSFDGWLVDGSKKAAGTEVQKFNDWKTACSNITATAQWKANKYTVTFDAGTAEISPKTIDETYDSNYVFPTLTEREGYNFLGWFTEDGTKVTVDDTVKITEPTTLYAHWSYDIEFQKFYSHGGSMGEIAPANDGEDYELDLTPDEGYMISAAFVDGEKVNVDGNSYTFKKVDAPHSLQVNYVRIPFALNIVGVDNAEVDPTGIINLFYGDSASIFAKANPGYFIKAVKVNGKALDLELPLEDDTFKLENIQENDTVTFEIEK